MTEAYFELDGKRVPFPLIEGEGIDDRAVRLARAVAEISHDPDQGVTAAAIFWGGFFKRDGLSLDELDLLLEGFAPFHISERWSSLMPRLQEAAKAGSAA